MSNSTTSWTAACQAPLCITNSQSLPKPMSIESVRASSHLIICRPLLLRPQSFPASGSFQMSQLFASGGQSIGVSTSTAVLPMNTQDWSLGWTGWISLQSKGLSRVFPNTTVHKHQFFSTQLSLVQFSHLYMTTGKTIALTRWTIVGKVTSLLFNILSRLVITFLPRSKHFFNFMAAITICSDFEAQKIKSATVSPSICHEVMGPDAMIFIFWMLSFKPTFFTLFHFHQETFYLHFLP